MNFLGHLALAWPNPNLMVGGFFGDFVKGPLKGDLPKNIEAGIRLHRRIDAQSDRHPSISKLKAELPPDWARYAGILADMYCDYLLSNSENNLLPQSTGDFADACHQILQNHQMLFSENAKRTFEHLFAGQWLAQYAELEFTSLSLQRIGTRLKFKNPLHQSREVIAMNQPLLEQCCRSLYFDMIGVVHAWHAEERENNPENLLNQ